jgi:hypothetical protein
MLPATTRLRYVKAKSPDILTKFCDGLGKRIEIKCVVKDGAYWVMWFVPDDKLGDVKSGELVLAKQKDREVIGYLTKKA